MKNKLSRKRLISLALCLVLCLALLTVAAFAEGEYNLWVGNTQVTSTNKGNILGDSTASYNSDTNTLTLNNAAITGRYTISDLQPSDYYSALIYSKNIDLKIVLPEDQTLNLNSEAAGSYGIYVDGGSLTITGDVSGTMYQSVLYASGDITVHGDVTADTTKEYGDWAICSSADVLIDGNATLGKSTDANITGGGIQAKNVTITGTADINGHSNCAINAYSTDSGHGNIKIGTATGGNVTIQTSGNNYGLSASGNITLGSSEHIVTFNGTTGSTALNSTGSGGITVYGNVTANPTENNWAINASGGDVTINGNATIGRGTGANWGIQAKNVTITGNADIDGHSNWAINATGDIEIGTGEGTDKTLTINSTSDFGLHATGSITIGNEGSPVTVNGTSSQSALWANGDITVYGDVSAKSTNSNWAIYAGSTGDVTINGNATKIDGADGGIQAKNVTITGDANIDGHSNWAINASTGDAKVTGNLTATGTGRAIYAGAKIIVGDGTWNVTASGTSNVAALYAKSGISIPETSCIKTPESGSPKQLGTGTEQYYTIVAPASSETPAAHVVIGPEQFTVTFDMNGHGTQIDPKTVNNGDKVTEPAAPTESGWTFDGWYTDEACTNAWDFEVDTVTADTTLLAKWTQNGSGTVILPQPKKENKTEEAEEPEEPTKEEPKPEEPATEEPKHEEPVIEEPAPEEPVIEEPAPEEPQEAPAALPETLPFADVATESWYYEAVRFVYGTGLMNGVSGTEFDPNGTTTRAMVATILWRLSGAPEAEGNGGFADVPMDQWYTTAIAWAAKTGLVTGYDEDHFGPNDPITREQLVAILYRLAVASGVDVSVGEDTNILSYNDAFDISDYAIPAFQWGCGAGLVQGTDGDLLPKDTATRAQIATLITRVYELIR